MGTKRHYSGLDEVTCLSCGGHGCERCGRTGVVDVGKLTKDEHRRHFDGPTDAELGGVPLTLDEVP